MAKRGEIPPEKNQRTYKFAASKEQVQAVRERVEALGWGWHDAVADAGISRNVGFTLLRGEASIGSLRTIEAWVVKKEGEKGAVQAQGPHETWAAIGTELAELGEDELRNTVEALKEYISAEKRRRAAFSKLLRPNPDPKK